MIPSPHIASVVEGVTPTLFVVAMKGRTIQAVLLNDGLTISVGDRVLIKKLPSSTEWSILTKLDSL